MVSDRDSAAACSCVLPMCLPIACASLAATFRASPKARPDSNAM